MVSVCTRGLKPPTVCDKSLATPWSTCQQRASVPVKSVVGAGDCFAAHLALAKSHGFSLHESAEIAYSAGRTYVQHLHNRPIMPHEVARDTEPERAKVVTPAEMRAILDVRYPHARTVFTNGCFCLLHAGHASTLRFARQQGDVLMVAVNDDASVRRLKGENRPVQSIEERVQLLSGLQCVDFVIILDDDSPEKMMGILKPTILVKGPDYAGKSVVGSHLVKEVLFATEVATTHSSDLIERLRRLV